MGTKKLTANGNGNAQGLFVALDVGNGECAGVSTEVRTPVKFEPLIAPMTTKRGLSKDEERPTYSLRDTDDTALVFGLDDVYLHGQRDAARRQHGMDRYQDSDYFNLIDVLLLHLLPSYRGRDERVSPTIAVNVPVDQFNKEGLTDSIVERLSGPRNLLDHEGCLLQLSIDPRKVIVLPESTGALMHYAFGQDLQRRGDTSGYTLVIDIGFETTDATLYDGMRYQRDRAQTFHRTGMGNIARVVADGARKAGIRDVDVSQVDRQMRRLAGMQPGGEGWITLNGREYSATKVYQHAIKIEAKRIADNVMSAYQGDVSRVVVAGGGAYHLITELRDLLPFQKICTAPEPELANVYGALTTLLFQAQRKG